MFILYNMHILHRDFFFLSHFIPSCLTFLLLVFFIFFFFLYIQHKIELADWSVLCSEEKLKDWQHQPFPFHQLNYQQKVKQKDEVLCSCSINFIGNRSKKAICYAIWTKESNQNALQDLRENFLRRRRRFSRWEMVHKWGIRDDAKSRLRSSNIAPLSTL